MPNKDFILFLDLETTGNKAGEDEDGYWDEILEVGLVLIRADDLSEVERKSWIVRPSMNALNRLADNDVVWKMHQENGLYDDLRWGSSIEDVDSSVEAFIKALVPGNDHIPYGGSGVAHFDRKYIAKWMPRLNKRITYWAYDVGNVRRINELAGGKWLPDAKTHRALDDALYHVEELRHAVQLLDYAGRYQDLNDA